MARPRFPAAQAAADSRLVLAARQGDGASLGLLFEQYRPRLYASALLMLGHRHEAEDAVADGFLTALTRLEDLHDPQAVGGWLHAIVRNRCLMVLRQRRSRPMVSEDDAQAELAARADPRCVEQQVHDTELRDWIWCALARLPETQRATVMLRYFGRCHSYEEIATLLGVPVGTVRSRLFDARLRLADELLACAGRADDGMLTEATRRGTGYAQALGDAYDRQRPEDFLLGHTDDLVLRWPDGRILHGRPHLRDALDADLLAGVRLRPQHTMASGGVMVVEGRFENPASDPHHCPPGMVLVVWHDDEAGAVRRVHIHHLARPIPDEA
ncbi:MAG TPA: RNA polymerase sigma factor [Burkholderiaceae bacterium]|nr:RNA polymerase sigma factor [Burkholderiaceae bacterium]